MRAIAPRRRELDWVGAWRGLLYRGRTVECPCCGRTFRHFLPDARGSVGIACPRCQSHGRHRALWLYLSQEHNLGSVLHIAPEPALERRLRELAGGGYVSADLESPQADVHADVVDLPFEDESFDLILCSHVLEHVPDDRAAMRELSRVLRRDGRAIFLVPVDFDRDETLEDPAIATPEERLAAYWQEDHVRLYGRDFAKRLADAGFDVTVDDFVKRLDDDTIRRYGLSPVDDFYVCRRRPSP